MMGNGIRWTTAVLVLAFAGSSVASPLAQGSGTAPTCRALLTDQDVSKAAGQTLQFNSQNAQPDHTACTWIAGGGGAAPRRVTVIVRDPRKGSPPQTLEAAFDEVVADAMGMFKKQEPLKGIGRRAVYFPGDPDMQVLFVQRADAVVIINATGVSRDGLIALARLAAR